MVKVGLVTIGQSPRIDVTNDLAKILPKDVEILEAGALDDLDLGEIKERLAPKPGELLYVTRLKSGLEVKVSKERILGLMQAKINLLEKLGAEIIGILCSGEFPEFSSGVPILYPDKILKGVVSGIQYRGSAVVLIPSEDQVLYASNKWSPYLKNLEVIPISPYTSKIDDFEIVGKRIRDLGAGLVVMDCMGYSTDQKSAIGRITRSARIITSRGALGRALAEMI
ncbi:MAG TPA: AroM family protein [Sulfolobales archaeon]|nr:AroM family protein [Sulfolobales archaeon]